MICIIIYVAMVVAIALLIGWAIARVVLRPLDAIVIKQDAAVRARLTKIETDLKKLRASIASANVGVQELQKRVGTGPSPCFDLSPDDRYLCIKTTQHQDDHHATGTRGEVLATWPRVEQTSHP